MKSLFAAIQSLKFRVLLPVILITRLLSADTAKAQDSAQSTSAEPSMHFGMKIMPSLAWIRTDTKNLESNGSEFRFTYGFITEFKFAQHYYFATGIDINNRGGSTRYTMNDSTIVDQNFKLQYLEIPITLKLKTNEIGYISYYLQFGLAPGFNLRAVADQSTTVVNSGGGSKNTSEDDVDVSDNVNFFNLSMIISLGAEYRISGNTALFGALTFSNGFADVAEQGDVKMNSDYLGLSIGVLF